MSRNQNEKFFFFFFFFFSEITKTDHHTAVMAENDTF